MPHVEAIVLAAGASRRFGPKNKLLQPFGETTVVGSVVRALAGAGLSPLVVTGHEADRVAEAVAPAPVVFNPEWASGMGSSLAFGVAACATHAAILVALGDMPELRPEVVRNLIHQLPDDPEAIVAPVYAEEPGRLGHPVIFGPDHRAALLALTGDTGARTILASAMRLIRVRVEGSLYDWDVPT